MTYSSCFAWSWNKNLKENHSLQVIKNYILLIYYQWASLCCWLLLSQFLFEGTLFIFILYMPTTPKNSVEFNIISRSIHQHLLCQFNIWAIMVKCPIKIANEAPKRGHLICNYIINGRKLQKFGVLYTTK